MNESIELTQEEKAARIEHLKSLQNHPGWKIIQEELNEDIAITESKLFGEQSLGEGETIEGLRRERIDRLELKDLPKNLIDEYRELDTESPSFDVYDGEDGT